MKLAASLLIAILTGWATDAFAGPCPCSDFFVGKPAPFIAEGITRDPATDRIFVAGVASRRILAIHDGRAREFARLSGDYSPFGITVAGGKLWVSAAVVKQGVDHEGPSALIALDLADGKTRGLYPVQDDGRHVLNDVTVAPDGTVYSSDALDGSLYALVPGASMLTRIGPRKLFKSPQGMVVSADGKSLLVIDYPTGPLKLDIATATAAPLKIPEGVNAKGIDGLARLRDGSFLASQNGTKEPHILRLTLSPDWSELVAEAVVAADDPAVADPSLVAADDSGAYVVGVSQWGSYGKDQKQPTKPLLPWRIVKLDLGR